MSRTLETLDHYAETLEAMTDQNIIRHGAVTWHENHGYGVMFQ